jgi:hypothetical protein
MSQPSDTTQGWPHRAPLHSTPVPDTRTGADPAGIVAAHYDRRMASRALRAFLENMVDVRDLIEIAEISHEVRGHSVLNRTGIVLTCSYWEACCEDVAADGLEAMVQMESAAQSGRGAVIHAGQMIDKAMVATARLRLARHHGG